LLPAVVDHFLASTKRPLVGTPHMPDRVRVASPELAQALQRVLPASVDVVCAATPELDDVLRAFAEHASAQRSEGDETYLGPDMDPPMIASLFSSAARFFRAAPWNLLDPTTLLAVTVESLGIRDGVLAVMGNEGVAPGLVYFESFRAFEANIRAMDAVKGEEPKLRRQTILDFDRGAELPASMRKEVAHHHWEVATAFAYPWVTAVDDDGVQRPATQAELVRMQLFSGAVADLFEKTPKLEKKLEKGETVVQKCSIESSTGERVAITLKLPFADDSVAELNQNLLDELLDSFDDSPEARALGRSPAYALLVPELALAQHIELEELTAEMVTTIVFEIIPEQIALGATEARTILEDTRAMLAFLHRDGALEDLAGCLEAVDLKHVGELEKALGDPTRFGMAKSLLLAGIEAGFDMSSEEGIRGYLAQLEAPKPARKAKAKPTKRAAKPRKR
jgi:hypothetical protein